MTFADFGIQLGTSTGEEVAALCPKCSHKRKNSKAKCLSVNTVKGVWVCMHCDWRGTLKSGEETTGRKIYTRPIWHAPPTPGGLLQDWFMARRIGHAVLEAEGVTVVEQYLSQLEERVPCIAFPYHKQGDVVNIKYRGMASKSFQQVPGAEKILYRQDSIRKQQVVIVEGEIDALSLVEAGITSVVSVPDGAPAVNTKNYAAKFTYLDQDPDPFDEVEKIILAVDADEPGKVLQRELSRRLGTDRCWFVEWPQDCKDANETLLKYGSEFLRLCIEQALPFPVQDVVTVGDISESVTYRYFHGVPRGLSTGWSNIDQYYTIEPGQLTIVTGIPGHGKSEWLDALMLQMAYDHEWRFLVCSPENCPVEQHLEKLLEKAVGAPFRVGPSNRMTPTDLEQGIAWLAQYVTFIMPTESLSIKGLLDKATIMVRRQGIRGLIIDPYNEFDHTRPKGQTETEYIGETLSLLKRWSRKWQVHTWMVAHPQKLFRREDGTYPVPTPWDINGSANFRNKAENCITVWRDEADAATPVQIHFQKIRFKHIGMIGMVELLWDRATGRYSVPVFPPPPEGDPHD